MLVRNRVIRIRHNHDNPVHPDVSGIAFQINCAAFVHCPRERYIRHRKWKVVVSRTDHMNRVQNRIAALDRKVPAYRDQSDVRYIPALLLVKMPARIG